MDGARERLVWRARRRVDRPLPSFEGSWVKGRRRQTFRDMLFTIDHKSVEVVVERVEEVSSEELSLQIHERFVSPVQ